MFELAYDSWVTIGIDQGPFQATATAPSRWSKQTATHGWKTSSRGNLEINSFFGGFVHHHPRRQRGRGRQEGLLAQLTTDGTPDRQLYAGLPEGNGENAEYLTLSFGNSSCGCTDEAACNYSDRPVRRRLVRLPQLHRVHDEAACNYEEGATVEDGLRLP